MARSKATIRRTEATLQDVRDNPAQYVDQVVWVPTDDLLAAHNPENPRLHEEDPPAIFKSILWMGWGEYGMSYNPLTGYLTGGHGRSMAADIGRKQDLDTFEKQWERWLKEDPRRKEIAEIANQRFQPSYWESCPVVVCMLIDIDQKTLMLRLNDTKKDGRDDPARMAAVLAQLPRANIELTGWSPQQADAFKAAFIERAPDPEPEPEAPDLSGIGSGYEFDAGDAPEGTEYEGKERFERPDATDYSGTDWGDDDATSESGPVVVTGADGERIQVAQVDEDIGDVGVDVFKHSSHYSETRAILYVSKDELKEWKDLVTCMARVFGVDSKKEIAKVWRTQATLATLRWVAENHPGYAQAQADILAESQPAEDSNEEEEE